MPHTGPTPDSSFAASRAAPVLAATLGILCFTVMDAMMKRATLLTGVYDALLIRSVISAVLVAPFWLARRTRWPTRAALALHAQRSLVATGVAAFFFWGLERTPIAQAIAISFMAPVIALWLSSVILREKLRLMAVGAALLGLAGVVVITWSRIAAAGVNTSGIGTDAAWGIGAILVSAVLYAWNLIIQRRQAQVTPPIEVAQFQAIFVTLFLGFLAPWLATPLPGAALGWIAISAVLSTTALTVLAWGWARAEAQVLLPVEYTGFIWAAIAGRLMFGEPVTATTMAGAALIVAGCWLGTRAAPPHAPDHTEQTAI